MISNVTTQIPATIPSLASLFSSRLPHDSGLYGNRDHLASEETTLAEVLAGAGYRTMAVAYGVPSQGRGLEQGFHQYNGASPEPGNLPSVGFGTADEVSGRVEDWFSGETEEPFFGWIHFWDPHQDYSPPPPYDSMHGGSSDGLSSMVQFSDVFRREIELGPEELASSLALYDGEISFVDREIGKVLARLEQSGLTERTIVVLAADHGEDFYEHHRYIGHGRFLYEAGLHVPTILSGPHIPAGSVVEGDARLIDLAPTLLKLLDVPMPDSFEGRSFAGSLAGGGIERSLPTFSLLEDGSMMTRRDGWKLAVHRQTSTMELFDLMADPGERKNLADDATAKRQEMEESLRSWAKAFSDEATRPRNLPSEFEKRLRALGYID